MKRNLLCRIFGHKLDWYVCTDLTILDKPHLANYLYCKRCGWEQSHTLFERIIRDAENAAYSETTVINPDVVQVKIPDGLVESVKIPDDLVKSGFSFHTEEQNMSGCEIQNNA